MKKLLLGSLLCVISILFVGCGSDTSDDISDQELDDTEYVEESSSSEYEELGEVVEESETSEMSSMIQESSTTESSIETPTVSREYTNALGSANDYLDYTSFSKTGLKEQLIYEGYPDDAAQYAVDNIQTDWNQNALQSAIAYLDYSSFSDQGLIDQLVYEGYSQEEAQYAINNLPN